MKATKPQLAKVLSRIRLDVCTAMGLATELGRTDDADELSVMLADIRRMNEQLKRAPNAEPIDL